MNFKISIEQLPQIPTREQVVTAIQWPRFSDVKNRELLYLYLKNFEKQFHPQDEEMPIQVDLECVKIYYDAGYRKEAYDMLTDDYEGVLRVAKELFFPDVVAEIYQLLEQWKIPGPRSGDEG